MEISQTGYYLKETNFLREPPEAEFTTFSDEGFVYFNGELECAMALRRASKSNYEVTVISGGEMAIAVEHSIEKAMGHVKTVIQNARS